MEWNSQRDFTLADNAAEYPPPLQSYESTRTSSYVLTTLSSYFESWCCIGKEIMTMLNALHVKCKELLHGLFSQTAFSASKSRTPTEFVYMCRPADHTGASHLPFSSPKRREYTPLFMILNSMRVDNIYCQFSTL